MAISMLKIRRPLGRLIFNMGIAIPGKTIFLIETAPWCLLQGDIATAYLNNKAVLQQEVTSLPAQGFTAYGTSGFGWAYFDNLLIEPVSHSFSEIRGNFDPEPVLIRL